MATPHFPVFNNRKQDAQTIHLPMVAYTRVNGVTLAADGQTLDITADLTTALNTAARNSQPVPLQLSTSEETRGVVVGSDLVQVYDADGLKIDVGGDEVFGILSENAGAFTVTFNTSQAGVPTPVTIPAQDIGVEIPYRFDLHELPSNALIAITARNVSDDIEQASGQMAEELTIAVQNTVPNLSNAPNVTDAAVWADYRGFTMSANLPTSVLTVADTGAVTYDAAASGLDLNVGEIITVYYAKK